MASHRISRPDVTKANDCWTMNFISDALFNGKRFRALTIMDQFTRECLAIRADQNIRGEQVVALMSQLSAACGVPKRLQTDNGSEFIRKALDKWAYENRVTMGFSRPGRLIDNPFIESFNGSFRDECLNIHWFLSLADAREKIENWRVEYEMPSRVQPFPPSLGTRKHPTWTVRSANRRLFVSRFLFLRLDQILAAAHKARSGKTTWLCFGVRLKEHFSLQCPWSFYRDQVSNTPFAKQENRGVEAATRTRSGSRRA